jgi:hypothetical protein
VVCIVTDGMENSSLEYTPEQVNDLITARKTAGWTFIFLAANQDAIAVGSTLKCRHVRDLLCNAGRHCWGFRVCFCILVPWSGVWQWCGRIFILRACSLHV